MVRTARFSESDFITATMALVAEGGPAAATMQAIARRVGAPTGSIYHRFPSRSAVLAMAWHTAFGSFTRQLAPLLRAGRAQEAAMAIVPWVAEDMARARFLLLNDAVGLFEDNPPPATQSQALEQLEADFDSAFHACLTGGTTIPATEERLARARFLIFDAPIAILRPYLLRNAAIPDFASRLIADLHQGLPVQTAATTPTPSSPARQAS